MTDLRALTLIRPMAAAIVHGSKRIENRPMNLPRAMRGVETVVAVHAGRKWSEEYERAIHEIDGVWQDRHLADGFHYAHVKAAPYEPHMHDEGIVGLMLLSGRVFTDPRQARCLHAYGEHSVCCGDLPRVEEDPWWSGPFGYAIQHAVALDAPIAHRGMQGFWPVGAHVVDSFDMKWARERLLDERSR